MIKRVLMASAALALSAALAQAQEVKIGLVAPFTGIGAELGQQIDRGATTCFVPRRRLSFNESTQWRQHFAPPLAEAVAK